MLYHMSTKDEGEMSMQIDFNMEESTLLIKLNGEIDHHTSVEIREAIDREYQKRRAKNVLFDFGQVLFMDSSGIGMLMGRYRNVVISGGQVGLLNVDNNIDKVLAISGIYKLMKVYGTKQDALAHLA